MNVLIINSHPYSGSFMSGAAKNIAEVLTAKGETVTQIDLVADAFNPVMTSEDLRLWGQGKTQEPLVQKYMAEIEKANLLVFPFPIWWGAIPAVLKGFCDKVLLPGWAYHYDEQSQPVGHLSGKKAVVITTMQTPTEIFHSHYGDPVEGAFIKDTLQTCGFEVIKRIEIDQIVSGGRENAEKAMNNITDYFQAM